MNLEILNKNIDKNEIFKFLLAGFSAVFTDLISYYILINFLSHDISKGISFVLGSVVAYLLNKYWTFQKSGKSFKEIINFIILYLSSLSLNIFVNKFVLDNTNMVFLAFLVATSFSTILNFLGQKFWVFRK